MGLEKFHKRNEWKKNQTTLKRFLIAHFEIRVIFFQEKTKYFLICQGDSNRGGEQGPKGAQVIGVGVDPKAIPLSNVMSPFLDPANPLN